MSKPPSPTRYELLDVMRGFAALWIFSFHVSGLFTAWGRFIHWLVGYGFLAISVFFIISGYSISASMAQARRKNEPALHFLYRRYRRVYGPLWCSVLVTVALPWFFSWISSL